MGWPLTKKCHLFYALWCFEEQATSSAATNLMAEYIEHEFVMLFAHDIANMGIKITGAEGGFSNTQ